MSNQIPFKVDALAIYSLGAMAKQKAPDARLAKAEE
jgi:hypothetical protein